jgi:proteic killer suppression protein
LYWTAEQGVERAGIASIAQAMRKRRCGASSGLASKAVDTGAADAVQRARYVKRRLTFAGSSTRFLPVIRSFRNRGLKRYFEAGDPRGLSVQNVARVGRILRALDAAARPEEVNLPGFYWHPLQGEARWAIRVTGNWRISFAWDGADAVAVDLEDNH